MAGCSYDSKKVEVNLNIPQQFPLILWKTNQSHLQMVKGKLEVNGIPVSNATLLIDQKKIETNSNGVFEFLVDQSKLFRKTVIIKDVNQATIDGKSISRELKEKLLTIQKNINVYYPIFVQKTEENGDRVTVYLKAATDADSPFPTVGTGKYAMKGIIKDFQGKPVEGAIVSTTREKGEGWAKSQPTNSSGQFLLSFISEDGEDQTFRVSVGGMQYTLPKNKVFHFPGNTSIEIHAVLPKRGQFIQDRPPTLISRTLAGAMYSGIIIGLDGISPKTYHVTIPDERGLFSLTLSKKVWAKQPTFFETRVNVYTSQTLKPGNRTPDSWLVWTKQLEPNGIKPILKQ